MQPDYFDTLPDDIRFRHLLPSAGLVDVVAMDGPAGIQVDAKDLDGDDVVLTDEDHAELLAEAERWLGRW